MSLLSYQSRYQIVSIKELIEVNKRFIQLLLVFIVIGTTFACTSTKKTINETQSSTPTESIEDASNLEALYWARIDSAKMNFVQADVDFMTMMITHHAQALIMSDLAPKNDASLKIQVLSSRIINSQKDEIEIMQNWLEDRDQPVPKIHIEGLNLMVHVEGMNHMNHEGHTDHSDMIGMLSPAQLEELAGAKGVLFDELFLKYMIQHHLGATTMVQDLINTDGAVQDEAAFKLAADINADQKTEIARMRLMLQEVRAGLSIQN